MENLETKTKEGDIIYENSHGPGWEESSNSDKIFQTSHDENQASGNDANRYQLHEMEIADTEDGVIQGPEAIKKVKQQISQILVSKYAKQDKVSADAKELKSMEKDPIESVKMQISNMLMEKYADKQKSIGRERNTEQVDIRLSEKSSSVIEIHDNSFSYENHDCMKLDKNIDDTENIIEGYTLQDFEGEEEDRRAELNKTVTRNEEPATSEESYSYSIESGIGECEDKTMQNESMKFAGRNNEMVTKSSVLVPELIGKHVNVKEQNISSSEENIGEYSASEEEIFSSVFNIKPELPDEDNRALKKITGPATKVTLDLTTISKLTNIWDKSYKAEKKPKKSAVEVTESKHPSHMQNAKSDAIDSIHSDQSTSVVIQNSFEGHSNSSYEPAAEIQNLQISDSLKLKLMNRKHNVKQHSPLKKKYCPKASSTLKCNDGSALFTMLKRKVGRPKSLKTTLDNNDLIIDHSDAVPNSLSPVQNALTNNSTVGKIKIESKGQKRILGCRKSLNEKSSIPADKTNYKTLPHRDIVSDALCPGQNTTTDTEILGKTAIESKVQKRKVGRPKALKEKTSNSADKANITVLQTGTVSDTYNPEQNTAINIEALGKLVTGIKGQKRKVGGPKSLKEKSSMKEGNFYKTIDSLHTVFDSQNPGQDSTNNSTQTKLITESNGQKRKVGRPKALKAKGNIQVNQSEIEQSNLYSQSHSIHSNCQKQRNPSSIDNENFQLSKNPHDQKESIGQSSNSFKYTSIKEVGKSTKDEKYGKQKFNLKACFVRLVDVGCYSHRIEDSSIQQYNMLTTEDLTEKNEFKSTLKNTYPKTIKCKPGRPKKRDQLSTKSQHMNVLAAEETSLTSKKTSNVNVLSAVSVVEDPITNCSDQSLSTSKQSIAVSKSEFAIEQFDKPMLEGKLNNKKTKPGRPRKAVKENLKESTPGIVQTEKAVESSLESNVPEEITNDLPIKDTKLTKSKGNDIKKEAVEIGVDNWEEDWETDEIEDADSSDDYAPSDDEYIPNKKKVCKNASSSKQTMKKQVKQALFEPALYQIMTDKIEDSKKDRLHSTTTDLDEKQGAFKGTVQNFKRHKHAIQRIGRPPVDEEYKCKKCSFTTYEKNLFNKHNTEVHQREWMQCTYCDFKTRSRNVFLEHEGRKHTDSKPFKCDFEGCSYASNVHTDYQKHRSQKHTKEKPYKCSKCDYTTRWRRNISNHNQIVHNDVRAFVCDICNSAFKRKQDLKGHMNRHTDEKPLQCDLCGFRCKTNWEIKSHKLSHSNVRPYPCTHPGCIQACKTKADLTKHMAVHAIVKKFKCPLCSKMFKCYTSMKKHERGPLHSTDRNFPCKICGKAFKTKQSLTNHGKIHDDIRPFKCDYCSKEYITKFNLDTHKLTHRLDKLPFHCPICPFGTKLPGALLAHIGAAHGDSYAYYCELCKKPFKRYGQLQRHYRRCHTEEDRKKFGNAFDVDLALMKMEMELDLEDTFESVGVSNNKNDPSKLIKSADIKEEPVDLEFDALEQDMDSDSDLPPEEEFEAMEREMNGNSDLPPDIRSIRRYNNAISESFNVTKVPKLHGNPKKSKSDVIKEFSETITAEKKTHEIEKYTKNGDLLIEKEERSVISTLQRPNCETELGAGHKQQNASHIAVQNNCFNNTNENREQSVDKNGRDKIPGTEEINTSGVLEAVVERASVPVSSNFNTPGIEKNNDSETASKSTFSSVENETQRVEDENTIGSIHLTNNAKFRTQQSVLSEINESNSNLHLETVDKEKEDEISALISAANNVGSKNQAQDAVSKNISDTTDKIKTQNVESDKMSTELEMQSNSSNSDFASLPKPFFFSKCEGQFKATIAVYDGFRLPLATKGFPFNYDKTGKKTKSWFMDPSWMGNEARVHHFKYLQRVGQVAKPPRKKREFKGRKTNKLAARKKLSDFVNERRKKAKYYMKKRQTAKEITLTSNELKEMQNTEVFERQKRNVSFKGSYAEFETLEGEELNITEVQQRLPVVTEDERKVPKKKQKKEITYQENVSVQKKSHKKYEKKKKSAATTKPVLLYSEKKRLPKHISIRKPEFIAQTNQSCVNEEGQASEPNELAKLEISGTKNGTSALPQKRKPGRKPKSSEEKIFKKKVKAKHEPAQAKYKYVKRSKQKNKSLEETLFHDRQNTSVNAKEKAEMAKATSNSRFSQVEKEKTNKNKVKESQRKKMKVKIRKHPKQPFSEVNSQLNASTSGIFHETVANSNLVRVHHPQNVQCTGNEQISIPGPFSQQTVPANIDMSHHIQGGKYLMFSDDVVTMQDPHSSQEVFGLSVDQIKSETFIEPVEPFSINQVFNSGTVVNPVHPVLLTQSHTGQCRIPTLSNIGITEANILNTRTPDVVETNENLQKGNVDTGNIGGRHRETFDQSTLRLRITESNTDKEVMQLDYSIVKEEPEDELN